MRWHTISGIMGWYLVFDGIVSGITVKLLTVWCINQVNILLVIVIMFFQTKSTVRCC